MLTTILTLGQDFSCGIINEEEEEVVTVRRLEIHI